jgi:hypothetical protein
MAARRCALPALLFAALAAASCRPPAEARVGADARRLLEDGQQAAVQWVALARARVDVDEPTAVAAGYIERLRLGLGSPFRLVDYALADPRLPDTTRIRVAWALIARTISREAYHVDPAAIDPIGTRGLISSPGGGRYHLDLIDGAIRQATDPRAGELAVRIAYSLAAAEGALAATAPDLAARAASLIRDRELARSDALRLLGAARAQGQDPLRLLVRWRAEREFAVERPAMDALPAASELHALQMAPRLARFVADPGVRRVPGRVPEGQQGASLGLAAALRLERSADSLHMPPVAPIAVATRMLREVLTERPGIEPAERAARAAFIEQATTEEGFVAGLARLRRRSPHDLGPAAAALAVAVAMRSLAQEPVWFPGFGGPANRELQERYGLAAIAFGEDVDPEWRPYYRRMLDLSLSDLARVLPALRLDGLRVVFTDQGRPESTLALHDPKARRLFLPPASAGGAIAHEIAHDLDWQVALRRYRVRGDYATDRATRLGGDRLATRVQDLAGALTDTDPDRSLHSRRPAEVFARNVDWFVVVALAAQGRSNGYLSSAQDEMLTGHGTVRPPDISGVAGQALIAILDEVAPIYPETRSFFEKRYGVTRALGPWDLTRRVLAAGSRGSGVRADDGETDAMTAVGRAFGDIASDRDAALGAIDTWICSAPGAVFDPDQEVARRRLVADAARARAHGLALRLAREIGGWSAWQWMTQRLAGEPASLAGPADSTFTGVLASIVQLAQNASTMRLPERTPRIGLQAPPDLCATAPLRVGGL